MATLPWRHNEHDDVSNHQPHHCLLNSLFGRRSKKTSKLRVTGLWVGNSPGTGEFPAQMASNAENVSIWWRLHDTWPRIKLWRCIRHASTLFAPLYLRLWLLQSPIPLMMTSPNGNISALLAICAGNSPLTGEFPAQRPVTRSFDVFFDLRLNKRFIKQSWGWWFETLSRPLWRHRMAYFGMISKDHFTNDYSFTTRIQLKIPFH